MNIREYLHTIPELNITKRLQMMTKSQLELYAESLHTFTEKFPSEEGEVKAAMEKRDIKTVIIHLTSLRDMLAGIHAEELANDCWKHINSFDEERPEKIEAYVSYFLSTLTSLSIDIQLAFFKAEEDEKNSGQSAGKTNEVNPESSEIKSILAVDDDTYCLDTFKAALKEVPCKIIAVTSGLGALGVLSKIRPELFVLDIEMPGMDGIKLAQEIRAQGHDAPIIFITGKSTKEYVQKCMQAGAADFIVKPIVPQDAANRIKKFL
ncbi:MAG: response regulator [Treponema sp.]|nr:response regulator [Treponema sp.]